MNSAEALPVSRYMTASVNSASLTRLELAMIRTIEAFSRWCVFLHKDVSNIGLGANDVWLLHSIKMRGNVQNLSELLLFLNRNDVSTLQYSLRKLEQNGFVKRFAGGSRREAGYSLTPKGEEVTQHYAELREELLVKLLGDISNVAPQLDAASAALERMTGLYDQSTQTILNRKIMGDGRPL